MPSAVKNYTLFEKKKVSGMLLSLVSNGATSYHVARAAVIS